MQGIGSIYGDCIVARLRSRTRSSSGIGQATSDKRNRGSACRRLLRYAVARRRSGGCRGHGRRGYALVIELQAGFCQETGARAGKPVFCGRTNLSERKRGNVLPGPDTSIEFTTRRFAAKLACWILCGPSFISAMALTRWASAGRSCRGLTEWDRPSASGWAAGVDASAVAPRRHGGFCRRRGRRRRCCRDVPRGGC